MSDRDAAQPAGAAHTEWVVAGLLAAGPYAGLTIDEVARRDPRYLTRLVAAGAGGEELRAAALAALAVEPAAGRGRRGRGVGSLAHRSAAVAAWWSAVLALAALALGAAIAPRLVGRAAPDARATNLRVEPVLGATPSSARAGRGRSAGSAATGLMVGATATPAAVDPAAPCGERAAGSIPASGVAGAVGSFQGVEFRVASTKDTGKVTFLNSHDPYQGYFYVAVFPDNYAAFPRPPAEHFAGRCVVAQGTIELYKGTPQIVLQHPTDIVVVGD